MDKSSRRNDSRWKNSFRFLGWLHAEYYARLYADSRAEGQPIELGDRMIKTLLGCSNSSIPVWRNLLIGAGVLTVVESGGSRSFGYLVNTDLDQWEGVPFAVDVSIVKERLRQWQAADNPDFVPRRTTRAQSVFVPRTCTGAQNPVSALLIVGAQTTKTTKFVPRSMHQGTKSATTIRAPLSRSRSSSNEAFSEGEEEISVTTNTYAEMVKIAIEDKCPGRMLFGRPYETLAAAINESNVEAALYSLNGIARNASNNIVEISQRAIKGASRPIPPKPEAPVIVLSDSPPVIEMDPEQQARNLAAIKNLKILKTLNNL